MVLPQTTLSHLSASLTLVRLMGFPMLDALVPQVALITLNAPKKLNALTEAMGEELTARVMELREDKGVRVAILTGLHNLCSIQSR